MSTFDPIAIAIDWLDAYREGSRSIVDLYAWDAAVECCCGGVKVICGRAAITDYWVQRFAEKPAGALLELQMQATRSLLRIECPKGLFRRCCTLALMARLLGVFAGP